MGSRVRAERVWLGLVWSGLAAATGVLIGTPAWGLGALTDQSHTPIEQRVVLSIGPDRTSLWTQLRTDTQGGVLALIVPVQPTAGLDIASAAWMEALEAATAPRVYPPITADPSCPGLRPPAPPPAVSGVLVPEYVLSPVDVQTMEDATQLEAWAAGMALPVSAELSDALSSLGTEFLVVVFDAPFFDRAVTSTIRVTGPSYDPSIPLVLTQAGPADLLVTLWTISEGTAYFDGSQQFFDTSALGYDVSTGNSNYATERMNLLSSDASSWLLEASSRDLFLGGSSGGGDYIDGLVTGYYQRAAGYDGIDDLGCIDSAMTALATDAPVATTCPRASLGYVPYPGGGEGEGEGEGEPEPPCVEAPDVGQVTPDELRCGDADDLAVALSGQQATAAQLSRVSMRIGAGTSGYSVYVGTDSPSEQLPVLMAGYADTSGCGGDPPVEEPKEEPMLQPTTGSGSSSSGSGVGVGSGGSGSGSERDGLLVPVYDYDTSCGKAEVGTLRYYKELHGDDADNPPDAYYHEDASCGGSAETRPVSAETTPDVGQRADNEGCALAPRQRPRLSVLSLWAAALALGLRRRGRLKRCS